MRRSWAVLGMVLGVGCGAPEPRVDPGAPPPPDAGSVEPVDVPAPDAGTLAVSVSVSVTGPGSVVSPSLGLRCSADCEWLLPEGTEVRAEASSDRPNASVSWEGACAGTGECEFTAAAGVQLRATFREAEVDECAGLVPESIGPPVVVHVSPGSKHYCTELAVDGEGNVAVGTSGFGPHVTRIFSGEGDLLTWFAGATAVQPRSSGFLGIAYGGPSWNELQVAAWSPTGAKSVGPALPGGSSTITPAVTGGAVVVSTEHNGCHLEADGTSKMVVQRIGDDGTVLSAVDVGGEGCPGHFAYSDANNNTLVLITSHYRGAQGFPADRTLGRWLSADGVSLTPWFEIGPARAAEVAPLVGGGFALGDGNGWYATLPSGTAEVRSGPEFMKGLERHLVTLIHGGRSYATRPPWDGGPEVEVRLDVFAASGKHCGTLPLGHHGDEVAIGRDGTVAAIEGDPKSDDCTVRWWRGLLRQ